MIDGMNAVLCGGPERKNGGDAANGAFLISDVNDEAVGIGNEVHVLQDTLSLTAVDRTVPVVDLVEDHLFMAPKELPHGNDFFAERRARFADREKIRHVVIPETREAPVFGAAGRPFGAL